MVNIGYLRKELDLIEKGQRGQHAIDCDRNGIKRPVSVVGIAQTHGKAKSPCTKDQGIVLGEHHFQQSHTPSLDLSKVVLQIDGCITQKGSSFRFAKN